jgi:hypothetical protein
VAVASKVHSRFVALYKQTYLRADVTFMSALGCRARVSESINEYFFGEPELVNCRLNRLANEVPTR